MNITVLAAVVLLLLASIFSLVQWRHARPGAQHAAVRSASPAPNRPAAAALSPQPPTGLLWRPSASVAHWNAERSGYGWILRRFGASEQLLDRLAAGDYLGAIGDLQRQAAKGDRSAIRSLGWFAEMRCFTGRSDDQLGSYQSSQIEAARTLPAADAAWFDALLTQDIAAARQLGAACDRLVNREQIEAQLSALAAQGDGAAEWMLSFNPGNIYAMNRLSREAALLGFPDAEFGLALALLGPSVAGMPSPAQPGDPSALDWLRDAAQNMPQARGTLALCEYQGCAGSTPEIPAAVADARAAAELGRTEAIIQLGAELPPSVVPAEETEAWRLFHAALEERGCDISVLSVDWFSALNRTLASPSATPAARQLAEQYWQSYGAGALGC